MNIEKFIKKIESLLNKDHQSTDVDYSLDVQDKELLATAEKLIDARHDDQSYRMEFKDELFKKILKQNKNKSEEKTFDFSQLKQVFNLKALSTVGVVALVVMLLINIFGTGGTSIIDIFKPGNLNGILIEAAHAHDNFSLEAETISATGVISADSNFVLTSKNKVSKDDIEQYLSIEDDMSFVLSVVESGYKFIIDPVDDLESGHVVDFSVATVVESAVNPDTYIPYEYQWVFEVADHFKVYGTVPADQTTNYDLNSAIRFSLSHINTVDAVDYIDIEPAHPFRVEKDFKTLIVIPTKPWKKNELYTVTLKKGFGVEESLLLEEGDLSRWQLSQDKSVSFATSENAKGEGGGIRLWNHFIQTLPGQEAKVSSSLYSNQRKATVDVSVFLVSQAQGEEMAVGLHKLDDWMPFAIRQNKLANIFAPLNTATPMQSYEVEYNSTYARIEFQPINKAGLYILKIEDKEEIEYIVWDVTKIGANIAVSEDKGYIWTVDVQDELPLANTTVTTLDQNLGISNDDGVLTLDQSQINNLSDKEIFKVTNGEWSLLLPTWSWGGQIQTRPVLDGFMFTDQNLVHHDDTIRLWGLIREKFGVAPQEITAELFTWDYSSYTGKIVTQSQKINVDKDGFFSTSMELHDLREGFYTLQVLVGDDIFRSTYLEVKQFVTPEINIEVETQKKRVDAGDSNYLTIRTNFFDGVPAPYVNLNLEGDLTKSVQTNINGVVVVEAPSKLNCFNCSNYLHQRVMVHLADASSGEVTEGVDWAVSYKYLNTTFRHVATPAGVKVIGSVSERKYISDKVYVTADDWVESPATNATYFVRVSKTTSQPSELLSSYDTYTNKLRYYYNYKDVETFVGNYEGVLDENGEFSIEFEPEVNSNYTFNSSVTNDKGSVESNRYRLDLFNIPYGVHYVDSEDDLIPITKKPENSSSGNYFYESVGMTVDANNGLGIGNSVQLTAGITSNVEIDIPEDAYTMFFFASPNLLDYSVQSSTSYNLLIDKKHIPVVHAGFAMLYNGRIYNTPYMRGIYVDNEEFALNVEVETEYSSYKIRDNVLSFVTVTDNNGAPVQAKVNLKVLDKAYVELDPYSVLQNPLDNMWNERNHWERVSINQASHQGSSFVDGKGGGGGMDGRVNFEEMPYYGVVDTDKNGKAQVGFDLPDNLTTWSIVASAATTDYQGGNGSLDIVVSQDLRIIANHSDSYLVNDEPVVSAQAFGDNLSLDDDIEFAFYGPIEKISGKDYVIGDFPIASEVIKGKISEQIKFSLSGLEVGEYLFAIRATVGNSEDVLIKEFKVIPGRALTRTVQTEKLSNEWSMTQVDSVGRVRLKFGSEIASQAYTALVRICDCNARLDHSLSATYASRLLKTYFQLDSYYDERLNIGSEYKSPDGGYALFPFGDPNAQMSAEIMALLDTDEIAVHEAVNYFEGLLSDSNSTPEQLSIAFLGLASLDQPGLNLLRQFAGRDDLDLTSQLNVIDALLQYGDKTFARKLWQSIIEVAYHEDGGLAWLDIESDSPSDKEFIKIWTEKAALIAIALADDKHQKFYADLVQYFDGPVNPLIQVRYWEEMLKQQPVTEMSFIAKLNEEEKFITLRGYQVYSLDLDKEQLANFSVLDVKGNVSVMVTTEHLGQEVADESGLEVTRRYKQLGKVVEAINPEFPVDVEIVVKAISDKLYGSYLVEDLLPSSLVSRSRGAWWGYEYKACQSIPYTSSTHSPKSHVWLSARCPSVTVTYKARAVVTGGKYLAEGVKVTSSDFPEIKEVSDAQWLSVK